MQATVETLGCPQQPNIDDYADLNAQTVRACPTPEQTPFFMVHMGVAFHLA